MKEIILTRGKVTVVDDDVWEWARLHKWSYLAAGYAVRTITLGPKQSRMVLLHREIMHAPEGMNVHHISEDKLDNRRVNLELLSVTTHRKHHAHTRGPSPGKYKGVFLDKRTGNWMVKIEHDGRQIYLGKFAKDYDAALAYDLAATKILGPGCYLNLANGEPRGSNNDLSESNRRD